MGHQASNFAVAALLSTTEPEQDIPSTNNPAIRLSDR